MIDKNLKVIRRRHMIQWLLIPVVIITIGLGWKFPILGFSVPIVMLAGFILGSMRGRYLCGNFCPRGGFFDRVITPISRRGKIPGFFRWKPMRWVIFMGLMGFMVLRVSRNPADIQHWGRVFWVMCVLTTGIGIVLGIFIHPRAWCAFCPIGTLQNALGGEKHLLHIDSGICSECRLCEKACPFGLSIVKYKNDGVILDCDCLKCSECIAVCPKEALIWPSGNDEPGGHDMKKPEK